MSLAQRLADLWIGRKTSLTADVAAARTAVAHLKPVVLVTGASRGIGAAIARRFAQAGHDVALVARNPDELAATAADISAKTGRQALIIAKDVTERDAAEFIDAETSARGFYVDILINNAGIGLSGPFHGHAAADLDRLLALNVTALSRLMHHHLPAMRARRTGGILNVASLGGVVPGPNQAAYYASKAYVISLSGAVAAEISGQGVRVAVLAPGPVDTRFHQDMGAEQSPYRIFLPALSPERTARAAYRGFVLGQRLIIPGLLNRAMYAALRVLPQPLTVPIVAWLLSSGKE